MYEANKEIETLASDAAYYLIPELEDKLKFEAEASGWPTEIASQLSLGYVEGSLVIQYPDELEDTVFGLEYGVIGQPPKSVLRSFSYRADAYVKEMLANETFDLLMQYEDVF